MIPRRQLQRAGFRSENDAGLEVARRESFKWLKEEAGEERGEEGWGGGGRAGRGAAKIRGVSPNLIRKF